MSLLNLKPSMMDQHKHWQSFGERSSSDGFRESAKNEFSTELDVIEGSVGFLSAPAPRRDFLKYLGFSTAAAAIAASCEIPVKKSIPFVNKPEDIVPGVAYYYATTYVQGGDTVSVLAKVRDGRPIKIEGNELSPITQGGTSARVQASVLDLYDTARLRFPSIDGKEVTLEAIDRSIAQALGGIGGAPVVILTNTITSPTTLEAINQFIAKHPGSRHVVYDEISYSGILLANEATYGKRAIPSYRFDRARTIVSLGADFLGTWISPISFARQYSRSKKVTDANKDMSRHIQFESMLSMTGANADDRFIHRPSETGAVALALLNAINGQAVSGLSDARVTAGIEMAAKALLESKGESIVVCGSNDVNIQIIVNAINEAIQATGRTIDWSSTLNYRKGIDADMVKLVADMNSGSVGALLVHDANPAYSWCNAQQFSEALKKVRVTVSFSPKADETTQLCKYSIPDHHYLESWGDAEPESGKFSLMQPTIHPLFKTRQWQDSLIKWSGAPGDYLSMVKAWWSGKLGGETGWDKALQDGVFTLGGSSIAVAPAVAGPDATAPAVAAPAQSRSSFNNTGVAGATAAIAGTKKGGAIELVLYEKVTIGAGHGTANPWLQETPDPVTKATWDNYAVISPQMAKTLLGIDLTKKGDADAYEVHPDKHVLKLTWNGHMIDVPAVIIPGTHPNTVAVALGYGRTIKIGKAAELGRNAFTLTSLNGVTVSYMQPDVQVEKAGWTYKVAITQTHNIYDTPQGKRSEVMKEMTLAEFRKNPEEIIEEREEETKPYGGLENFEKQGTIYPYYDKPGIHWGMSVDLNTCTGCGACVVACTAENNVPVVGKDEVLRYHDMQWIRIDRYYSGDMENPKVVFQPLMCQHCDNAPCENVCPVDATNHSSEGLNQMAYNRCIGTRYCANNCPYKVRRFNWADYTGADSFPDNQREVLTDVSMMMNDDLVRMVLNPDVTVRSRGVMEKCSFCVQRCQEGKLKAKKESRPLNSAPGNTDIKTACQQACPTNAIVFGNSNDSKSAVTLARKENHYRIFKSLEQLHTLPNVNYLTKIRNTEEAVKAES